MLFPSVDAYPSHRELLALSGYAGGAVLPLAGSNAILGAVSVRFATDRRLTRTERDLALTLAAQCGQALERAQAFDREQRARQAAEAIERRLSFLAEAGKVLASSLDYESTLKTR
jgi:GAF domain-containing protein